jgi:diaminohydroxyphosphoribosylaminopyrimidine deaminase/5-amino-6-(5-phosphoribosylamino)uracil reductase
VRDWQGHNPTRIVLDPKKGLGTGYHVFDESARTYWLNTKEEFKKDNIIAHRFPEEHNLSDGLNFLYKEKLGSIIVEGGAATLKNFIAEGVWDEARVFTATKEFKEGIAAPELDIEPDSEQIIDGDRLSTIFNPETRKFWQKN